MFTETCVLECCGLSPGAAQVKILERHLATKFIIKTTIKLTFEDFHEALSQCCVLSESGRPVMTMLTLRPTVLFSEISICVGARMRAAGVSTTAAIRKIWEYAVPTAAALSQQSTT